MVLLAISSYALVLSETEQAPVHLKTTMSNITSRFEPADHIVDQTSASKDINLNLPNADLQIPSTITGTVLYVLWLSPFLLPLLIPCQFSFKKPKRLLIPYTVATATMPQTTEHLQRDVHCCYCST